MLLTLEHRDAEFYTPNPESTQSWSVDAIMWNSDGSRSPSTEP